jgi:hypothetical protein
MRRIDLLASIAAAAACAACSSDNSVQPDAGVCGTPVSGGGVLEDFTPPCDPGPKGVLVTASGEVLALGGYDFPPATSDDVYFVDGWEIRYDRVLATFDHVMLNENPGKSPTDQSQVGALVAQADGPWAVDLHKGGPLEGKGGSDEQAVAVVAIPNENKNGGAAFDPTMLYAYSFEMPAATAQAHNVNLDADDLAEYQMMIAAGNTALLQGTATWKGGSSCVTTDSGYDFTKLPPVVKFRLAFKAPTSYINAQNPENDPADPLPGEEHERGIKITASASTIAQTTFHLDHAFWESFVHDSPAHFDQFAAHYVGATEVPTAKLEDFVGAGFTPVTDANGTPVPWRWCYQAPQPQPTGALTFDTLSVPVNPAGDPAASIRDFVDYTLYNHSTWGHLNSDGLSFVQRHYPSPP